MKEDIYDGLHNYFSVEFITALANNMDEPNPGISKAIAAIIPTALVAVRNKSRDHSQIVYSMATDAARYYSKAPDVADLENNEKGSNLPHHIFGDNEPAIAKHIAAYSGLRPTSVFSLIMLVLPVMMGKLGEIIQRESLLDNQISTLFPGTEEAINRMKPAGYTIPDFSHHITPSKGDLEKIHEDNITRSKTNYVLPKWIPIVVVAVVVLLLVYFSRL